MNKNTEITMNIEKAIGKVGEKLELNLISWNGAAAKYDLRNWYTDRNGNRKYAKGITLTKEELKDLKDLLNKLKLN